jgi:hypothetical protein
MPATSRVLLRNKASTSVVFISILHFASLLLLLLPVASCRPVWLPAV